MSTFLDNLTWIPVDLPFGPIHGDGDKDPPSWAGDEYGATRDVLQVGMIVRVRQFKWDLGELSNEIETLLVGDINDNNGGCGCCSGISYRDLVIAYAWLPGFEPTAHAKGESDDRR
jgi:hypothetical protein